MLTKGGSLTTKGLPIVDEKNAHSPSGTPNGITPTPSTFKSQHNGNGHYISGSHISGSHNSASINYSGSGQHQLMRDYSSNSSYHHSTINPRNLKLTAPTSGYHDHQISASDSSRTVLVRSVSAASDGSEMIDYGHPSMNNNNKPIYHRNQSIKSYTSNHDHSPHHSFSDAGTVVIRQSVIDPNEDARSIYSHQTHGSQGTTLFNPMSPAMPPIVVDMHNNLDELIKALQEAKCEMNPNYDACHEALVSVTTNWDREKCEKTLKYMNAKENYKNHVILDLLGVLNAQLGKTEEAKKYHTEAIIKSNNKYIEAMHNYAYLLHRIGDKENDLLSVKYYKMALEINESFAHCWLHYGNLMEDDGRLKEAAKMYKKAISIRPTNAAFHLDLANVLDDLNEFEDASEQYLKCIELQPNDPVYHWNYAISLENQCFYYKAEESYKRAINLDFNCIDAHINYAHMLENQPTPQYKKALNQYEIILKMPEMINNTEIMLKCAKLYDHYGQHEKTELLYMNILQIDPSIEDTYILFARYLTNQNRIEDANACYQAGIRHVQTPKLQEHYIQFLKDINNIYNNHNHHHKSSNSTNNAFKSKLKNIETKQQTQSSYSNKSSYVPPSPFVTSVKAPQQFPYNDDDDDDNNNNNNDDMGFDYYRPAPNKNINGNNNNQSRGSKKTVNANEEGCIVM